MNVFITICARGGSKGVLGKNLRLVGQKKLIDYTLEQARSVPGIKFYAISSDSDEILAAGRAFGFHPVKRPMDLASDTAAKIPAIRHCVQEAEKAAGFAADICIDLDCTSPLRNVSDIQAVIDLMKSGTYDNVITGAPARRSPYFNLVELNERGFVGLSKVPGRPIIRRQDAPKCFDMNASIYGWKRDVLMESDRLFHPTTGLYEMPEERSLDIDSEFDFEIVSYLLKR